MQDIFLQSRRSPSEKRKDASSPRPPSRGGGSRPGSPKKAMKSREGTPKRGLKEKEGSPAKKSMRSRTSTPVQESATTLGPEDAVSPGDSRRSSKNMSKMEVDSTTVKRKPEGLPVPPQAEEKKMRTSSPVPPEPAKQEIPEKMEKTPTPPKAKSPTPPEPAKQQIPEKKEKTPTPPKSKSPAPSEPEKPQIPEKKDRSPAAPEPAKQQIPEKKARSPAPPSRQDQAKREKFTRPPIVMEASKSKTGKPGDSLTLEVEWQCHTSTVIEWYKDGTKIKMTDDYHATFDGTKARLTVRNLTEEKTGLYKCHAVCKYGEGQSSCMIKMDSSEEEYTRKRSIDEPPKDKPPEKKMSSLSVTKESDEESLSQSLAPAKRKKSRSKSPVRAPKQKSPAPEKTLDELPKQKVVRPDPDEVCSLGYSPGRSLCVVMTRARG
ncbi:immunoglobulin I-set domain protein [Ancylostoma caninum]|uniref:Immunoglobulin I-set domain protein n=1 Tax=Ancylostoma caninum TaxID=29170 RepID=A0A368FBS0_ANCCA|nr:immunoglobulin I-set domain protein [Ancylostoma caninum]